MARITRLVAGAALTWTLILATTPAWSLPPVSQWRAVSEQQISQRYTVPISDLSTGVTYQSVVLVRSANLDTRRPDGSGVNAPKSSIYLSLKWSSAPLAHAYGTPLWYVFYANMTPLPPPIVYVASDGKQYTSTRVDPIDSSQIGDATQNDGLLNANYYFTIPRSNRSGSVEILPSRTIGALFGPAGANDNTVLNVGGPTVIPVSFPKGLEYISPSFNEHVDNPSPTWLNRIDPFVQLMILLLVIGFVAFLVRRRRRRMSPTDEVAASETPVTGTYQFVPPQLTPTTVVGESEPEPVDTRSFSTGVRINVQTLEVEGPVSNAGLQRRVADQLGVPLNADVKSFVIGRLVALQSSGQVMGLKNDSSCLKEDFKAQVRAADPRDELSRRGPKDISYLEAAAAVAHYLGLGHSIEVAELEHRIVKDIFLFDRVTANWKELIAHGIDLCVGNSAAAETEASFSS